MFLHVTEAKFGLQLPSTFSDVQLFGFSDDVCEDEMDNAEARG